jgi:hypothetical protein
MAEPEPVIDSDGVSLPESLVDKRGFVAESEGVSLPRSPVEVPREVSRENVDAEDPALEIDVEIVPVPEFPKEVLEDEAVDGWELGVLDSEKLSEFDGEPVLLIICVDEFPIEVESISVIVAKRLEIEEVDSVSLCEIDVEALELSG